MRVITFLFSFVLFHITLEIFRAYDAIDVEDSRANEFQMGMMTRERTRPCNFNFISM